MSDTNEARAQLAIDNPLRAVLASTAGSPCVYCGQSLRLLRAVLASKEQGEHVDRDAVVREKPHHRDVLIRFFAGQNLKEISTGSKPGWLRRWSRG